MPVTVSHVKSNTIPDWTGTVTVGNSTGGTSTVAATNLVRPSDWNSAHAVTLNIAGADISGAFSNANGVSFGTEAGGGITASYTVPTVTQYFSNTATTFNGTNVSGSLTNNTNGLRIDLSVAAPGAGGGIAAAAGTQTATSGTVNFANSNGITFGMSNSSQITASHNGLTSQSNQAVSGANGSFTFQTVTFANSNGVSFSTGTQGLYATVKTDYLTTARASNDAIGLNTAGSNVTWTANSSGLSLDARGYAGTATGATNASVTANSGGISVSVGNYLTSQSNQAVSGANGSFTFQTVTFANSNGVSFSTGTQGLYATVKTDYLTTARASTDAIGLNTAGTNVTWTVNSSGLSLNAGGYAGTSTGFTGANISASMTHNTAGLALSMSVAAPGGGGALNVSAGTTSGNLQTIQFNDSNGVSWGLNGSTVTASVNAGGGGVTYSYFNPQDAHLQVTGQQGQGTLHIQPAKFPNVQFDRWVIPIVNTNSSNSSGSHTLSFWVGIYSNNAGTLSLQASTSSTTAVTHSGTAGSYSLYSGIRLFTVPHTTTINEGQYWIGMLSRTTSGGANGSYSQILASQQNSSFFGHFGSSVVSTMQYTRGLGVYTATTSGMPSAISFNQISGASNSLVLRQPIIYMVSGTY